ncbi:unnamed protein product, partial [Nesidiocoris tenuis]
LTTILENLKRGASGWELRPLEALTPELPYPILELEYVSPSVVYALVQEKDADDEEDIFKIRLPKRASRVLRPEDVAAYNSTPHLWFHIVFRRKIGRSYDIIFF